MEEWKNEEAAIGRSFEAVQTYSLKLSEKVQVYGTSLNLRAGIRMHEICFQPETARSVPLNFPGAVIWMGQVRKGAVEILLPDLGRRTIEAGGWFICSVENVCVVGELGVPTEVMALAVCSCTLRSLIELAEEPVANRLNCFICPNQLKPTLLQGCSGNRLQWLAEHMSAAGCDTLQKRLQLEAHGLEWISELFHQPDLAAMEATAFGCSDHDAEALCSVAQYLEKNLSNEHSLADLCRRFYINEFKLKRGFKAMFGNTVFGYLREQRFLRAEQLLKEGDRSVIEVANEVGYSNPSHFARGFDERFGMLPKAFQNMHQETPQ